jgi:hypothetical protein
MWLNYRPSIAFYLILSTAIVAVLVGCVSPASPTATLEPSLTDRSFLTDIPCAAPCWYGLELGKSTKADALAIAQTLSFIDSQVFLERPDHYLYLDGSKQNYVDATFVSLICREPEKEGCADLLFVNDSLKEIRLYPKYDLNFGDVVAHLGAPDYIQFSPLLMSSPLCSVGLTWKQRGIQAGFSGQGANTDQVRCDAVHKDPRVGRNLPVQLIAYRLPENSALASIPGSAGGDPWAGFLEP